MFSGTLGTGNVLAKSGHHGRLETAAFRSEFQTVRVTGSGRSATRNADARRREALERYCSRRSQGRRDALRRAKHFGRPQKPSEPQSGRPRALIHDCLVRGGQRGDALRGYRESNAPAQCGGFVGEHAPLKDVMASAQ